MCAVLSSKARIEGLRKLQSAQVGPDPAGTLARGAESWNNLKAEGGAHAVQEPIQIYEELMSSDGMSESDELVCFDLGRGFSVIARHYLECIFCF